MGTNPSARVALQPSGIQHTTKKNQPNQKYSGENNLAVLYCTWFWCQWDKMGIPEPSTSCPRGLAITSIFKLKRRIPSSNLREIGLKNIKRYSQSTGEKKKIKQIIKCIPRCKLANKKCQAGNQEGNFLQLYNVHFQKLIGTSVVLGKFMPRSRNTSNCWFWSNYLEEHKLAWGKTHSMVWTYILLSGWTRYHGTHKSKLMKPKKAPTERKKQEPRITRKSRQDPDEQLQPRGLWSISEPLKKFSCISGWWVQISVGSKPAGKTNSSRLTHNPYNLLSTWQCTRHLCFTRLFSREDAYFSLQAPQHSCFMLSLKKSFS